MILSIPKISVAMPVFDMYGLGKTFIRTNLEMLCKQTFKYFDLVITDNSETSDIKKVIDEYKDKLTIHYYKNESNLGMLGNTNLVLEKCTGELIKIIFLDDFFYSKDSLKQIVDNFAPEDNWLVTACEHSADGVTMIRPFYPWYNDSIHLGKNTISSPSVLTIRNKGHLLFDENLCWMMDCDYYKRCYQTFGLPKIVNEINVVNRIGDHQTTNKLSEEQKRAEIEYLLKKYA